MDSIRSAIHWFASNTLTQTLVLGAQVFLVGFILFHVIKRFRADFLE